MATYTLDLIVTDGEKINCEGCEQRIGNALRRLPGVRDVQASADTQRIAVSIDSSQMNPEQVQAKLGQLGYQVEAGSRESSRE